MNATPPSEIKDRLGKVGVTSIVEKLAESRLRWFGHMWRRPVSLSPRGRRRLRKTIDETIRKDLQINVADST
ncbi:hypothetical protein Lal_00019808 [Lupinus albus]|nr:hypothetical protein Lal_00019808 [Lupinus albus]